MSRYLFLMILAGLLLNPFHAAVAQAPNSPEFTRLFGVFAPKLGTWSEYAIFDKATGNRSVIRLSLVSVEDDAFWYEIVNREKAEDITLVRMLIKGDPGDPGNIKRLIMKAGAEPAREMDGDSLLKGSRTAGHMLEQRSGIPTSAGIQLKRVKTGDGTATVPAGTFAVSMFDIVDDNNIVYVKYKYSRDVRPLGIVASDTSGTTMVLAGYGTGAQSFLAQEPGMMSLPAEMSGEIVPDMAPGQGASPVPGNSIRKIPGMGTGYEPRR